MTDKGAIVDAINVCVSGAFPRCTVSTDPVGCLRDGVFAWRVKARNDDGTIAFEASAADSDSGKALAALAVAMGARCR